MSNPLAGYRPLRRLRTFVTVALAAYVASLLAAAVFDVLDWRLTTDLLRGLDVPEERERQLDRRLELVNRGFLAVYAATAVVFLAVLYRLASNARALTAGEALRAPSAAVIWFFVPVLSLFMPYLTVQQVWRASNPSAGNWRDHPPSVLVKRWWAFWLFSILFRTTERYMRFSGETLEAYRSAVGMSFVVTAVNVALAATTLLMIRHIAASQEVRYERLRSTAAGRCQGCGEPISEATAVCPVCGRLREQ